MRSQLSAKRSSFLVTSESGFSIVPILVLSVAIASILFSLSAMSQRFNHSQVSSADRAVFEHFKKTIPILISDNKSWIVTRSKNSNMDCLSNKKGLDCAILQPLSFDLYDAGSNIFFASAQSTENGFTVLGQRCGPHSSDPNLQKTKYPSAECPYRLDLKWVAMNSHIYPYVGIIATLEDKGLSVGGFRINIDLTQYDYSLHKKPLIGAAPEALWNTWLIYRKTID